jgi:hypothetical protein
MQRPTVVTVFSILNVVCGIAAGVRALFVLGDRVMTPEITGEAPLAGEEAVLAEAGYEYFIGGASVTLLVLGFLLIVAGVGLWHLRPWGRKLSIGVAMVGLLYAVIVTGITVITASGVPDASVGLAILEGSLYFLYSALIIIFLLRGVVRQAFHPHEQPPRPAPHD